MRALLDRIAQRLVPRAPEPLGGSFGGCPICGEPIDQREPAVAGLDGRLYHAGCVV